MYAVTKKTDGSVAVVEAVEERPAVTEDMIKPNPAAAILVAEDPATHKLFVMLVDKNGNGIYADLTTTLQTINEYLPAVKKAYQNGGVT